MPYSKEIKVIKLLQERSGTISSEHQGIEAELKAIKGELDLLCCPEDRNDPEFEIMRQNYLTAMDNQTASVPSASIETIYEEARRRHPSDVHLSDILSINCFEDAQHKIDRHVLDFNSRYSLDGWDYAIAGGCGLFAAMLDLLCVRAPLKPTASWNQKVDGIFNRWVQDAFNKLLPPDLSSRLSDAYKIGAPDSSTVFHLIGAPKKALNPTNHRLRALSHDPVIGLFLGVWDMIHGTCTTVVNGKIISIPSTKEKVEGNVFQLLGRMFGHLLSDVNAQSDNGNRGMGLPAPFMGLLRMFEGIPIGNSNFGKQIEWMYVNGYDFRQFIVTSIPMTIMEVMLRCFYVGKQVKLYDASFGATLLDTMPMRMNPRFRIMLALSYGVVASINSGKCYVTKNILNANYAAWMGLVWNGFHALKWSLFGRSLKFWDEVEAKEILDLETLVQKLDRLELKANKLPLLTI